VDADTAPIGKTDDDDDDDDGDGDDDGDDDGDVDNKPKRSDYTGRGNVQAVRAARKKAGLSAIFPRSDPLLREFGDSLSVVSTSKKDADNKVTFIIAIISSSVKSVVASLYFVIWMLWVNLSWFRL